MRVAFNFILLVPVDGLSVQLSTVIFSSITWLTFLGRLLLTRSVTDITARAMVVGAGATTCDGIFLSGALAIGFVAIGLVLTGFVVAVGRDKSIKAVNDAYKADRLIGVVAQKDSAVEEPTPADLESVGSVAKIVKMIKMPDGGTTVIIQGKARFRIEEVVAEEPYFRAKVTKLEENEMPNGQDFEAYIANIKDLATEIIQLSPNIPTEASIILRNIENPSFLIHFVSSNLNTDIREKQRILETDHIRDRADLLMTILQKELQFAELKNKVTTKTRNELDKQQREYFLQQQLKSIKEELGGDTNSQELKEMQKKADAKKWPQAARDLFRKGIEKNWSACIPAHPIIRWCIITWT